MLQMGTHITDGQSRWPRTVAVARASSLSAEGADGTRAPILRTASPGLPAHEGRDTGHLRAHSRPLGCPKSCLLPGPCEGWAGPSLRDTKLLGAHGFGSQDVSLRMASG